MKSKQLFFFTTLNDIKPVIETIESLVNVKYYLTGLLDDKNIPTYKSLLETPNVGYMSYGDWNWADDYLILPANLPLNIRDVPQRKGGVKFAVDQLLNQKSNTIKLGGIFRGTSKVLVAGRIGTNSEEEFSLELFKLFSSNIKKSFKKKIESFYIGAEAYGLLKEGWRLVLDEGRSKEYDLKLS